MSSQLETVCAEVLNRVTPSESEQQKVKDIAKMLTERVKEETKTRKIQADVRVEGSVAKNTWLKDAPEVDVFIRVPTATPRESFATTFLDIAKKATYGYKQIERFAEHPYLEAVVDGVWVNIVPCYKVESGKWVSATDRTPFHTDYVKPLLNKQKCAQVRLLKRFMKGVSVYGAEIKVGGFSGYLCELLVLSYGSFVEALRAAANWKKRTIIDPKRHYKKPKDAEKIFDEPLVMVDPVDKSRNVAAAVTKEKLNEFTAASRAFLKNPDMKFFYPPETTELPVTDLFSNFDDRGSAVVFVCFGRTPVVPDVLWGQLYRSQKALRNLIQRHDFKVMRDSVWSNETSLNVLVFEVETRFLPNMKKHLGPPLKKREDCEEFLQKHLGAQTTVSGPRVEGGRWVVDVKRKYADVVKLLKDNLADGGKCVGVADFVCDAVLDSVDVLVNQQVMKMYSDNAEFAKFLTDYLKGKPRWLQ
ncbi:MAG: CCA tRNA nucleotidyltransferase [Candidatus Bathyarchaeota archaeon]|nr:CCA tRNA nucleotidyltransferase [Candidatus Bathyarchaeota archaeon]